MASATAYLDSLPQFVRQLWKMVQDDTWNEVIRWNKEETGFLLCEEEKDPEENDPKENCSKTKETEQKVVSSGILTEYFNHNSFASFQRQLSNYSIYRNKKTNVYQHTHGHFNKNHPELLNNIVKRRKRVTANFSRTGSGLASQGAEVSGNATVIDAVPPDLKDVNPGLFDMDWKDVMDVMEKDVKIDSRRSETSQITPQFAVIQEQNKPYQGSEGSETGYSSAGNLSQDQQAVRLYAVHGSVPTITTCERSQNGYYSEEGTSSSQDQEFFVTMDPKSGPAEGGKSFCLEFEKSLPYSVVSALAYFGDNRTKVWKTYEGNCTMFGKNIPSGNPGPVTVKITTETGVYLGETIYTYEDPRKKESEQSLPIKRKLEDFSHLVHKMVKVLNQLEKGDDSEENGTLDSQQGGRPNQEKEFQPQEILKTMVYAAAEVGAGDLIETIFTLSAGRIVFEAYKNESSLPEHIAEDNGHKEIAAYLRSITKRYSKEENTSPGQSKVIDWLELADTFEKIVLEQSELSSDKDLRQIREDETGYSGDGETSSSSSERESSDSDDEDKRIKVFIANSIQMGLVPCHQMIERDIHDYQLPDSIGVKWKDLARALGYPQTTIDIIKEERGNSPKECCIDLLVRWMIREGRDATAGRLADALTSIGLKDLADTLICQNDPSQINEFEKEIPEMKSKLVSLEAKGSKLSARNKELEEENQTLRARLEPEDAREHEQEEDDSSEGTDQAERENRIDKKLKNINEQLRTYVTSPLQVPEVKQDQLKTPVKLDLLIRLSERLQELYTETLGMLGETCKCSEDLRRDFYDLAYHGLRAEHYDLVHRVKDLESAQEEMSEEDKKEYKRLQGYQIARQSQVEALNKLWRRLFSPNQTLRARLEPKDARKHEQESTDQADMENRIDNKLKNINEQLRTYVTSPLQVPEVKQDQLRTPVKLDVLIRLSERLQELYTETLGIVRETCKCNEDLRKDYYDLVYHGLRAEHYDLVHKVKDLESAREKMSEEEKEEYERLQSYQRDRQRQVDGLDKLWRTLLSPPERLHKTPLSEPTGNKPSSGKKATRHTDPGARPKKPKSREEVTGSGAPSLCDDGKSRLNRVTKMRSAVGTVIQNISKRKKESGDKKGSCVPYTLMRDS